MDTPLSQLLQVACVAVCFLQFGWAVRLWRQGLASNYPNLISYLMVSGLHTLIGMAVYQRYGTGPDAVIYGWFWVLTKPLMWALSLSVVLEIYQSMLRGYVGLCRLGQLMRHGALATAILLTVLAAANPAVDLSTWSRFWRVQEQSVYFGMTTLCVIFAAFAFSFRLKLRHNATVLLTAFGVCFGAHAGLGALDSYLGPAWRDVRTWADISIYLVSVSAAMMIMSPAGEETTSSAEQAVLSPVMDYRLTEALVALNHTLARTLR